MTVAPEEAPKLTMEDIQSRIFDALTAYEPTAEGMDEEEKARFDAWIAEELAGLATAEAEKADGYGYAIRKAEAEADFFRKESERFAIKRHVIENHIKAMKSRIAYVLREYDIKEIKGARYKLMLWKSQHVAIENAKAIPAEYTRVIPATSEPDKTKIKEALKAGTEVAGTFLEDSYTAVVR